MSPQAELDSFSFDRSALVTVRATSAEDPFYDGMVFSFLVPVRPSMSAPASAETVTDPLLPVEVGHYAASASPDNTGPP